MSNRGKHIWRGFRGAFARNVLYYNPVLTWALGICTIVAAATTLQNGWILSQVFTLTMVPVCVLCAAIGRRVPRYLRAAMVPLLSALFYTAAILLLRRQYGDWTTLFRYFLPLIAVNSLILSRGVRYAPRQSVTVALLDSVTCAVGFAVTACTVGLVRGLLADGLLLGKQIHMAGVPFFGFIMLGFLAAVVRAIRLCYEKRVKAARLYAEKRKGGGAS
jgi:electron transport complex protein RnfE